MNNDFKQTDTRAYLRLCDVTGSTENCIEVVELDNGFTYYSRKLFAQRYHMSERTLHRREKEIACNPRRWRYLIKVHGYKTYFSVGMLGIKKKNLHERSRAEYIQFLGLFDWDLIGTVRRYGARDIPSVRKAMESLNTALKKKYAGEQVILWYNVEKNPDESGYHAHFVLKTSVRDKDEVKGWISHYLGKHHKRKTPQAIESSIHLDRFKSNENWLAYITKQMKEMPDGYDLLSTQIVW